MNKSTKIALTILSVLLLIGIVLAIVLPLTLMEKSSENTSSTNVTIAQTTVIPDSTMVARYKDAITDASLVWTDNFLNDSSDEFQTNKRNFEESIDSILTKYSGQSSVTVTVLSLRKKNSKIIDAITSVDFIFSLILPTSTSKPNPNQLQDALKQGNKNWTVEMPEYLEATCEEGWDYDVNGPTEWPSFCQYCSGSRQSPIEIWPDEVLKNLTISKLQFTNYALNISNIQIKDNGHTAYISLPTDQNVSVVISKYPEKAYKLQQIHFHWGFNDNDGSEHSIRKVKFPIEIHLVHKYTDTDLAVLAVFGQISLDSESELLQQISEELNKVHLTGETATIPGEFSISEFLPHNTDSFFTYSGSLTTPPCSEIVEWTILAETIKINQKTIDLLRNLRDPLSRPLKQNYRDPQRLYGRPILFRGKNVPSYES